MNYDSLVKDILGCTKCRLHLTRKHAVPGEGPLNARVMLIGEAPGRVEDEEGRPFVGAAGRLLNELLSMAGLSRGEVYITNLVKCRPPNNRDPMPDEVESCRQYLVSQILIIKPRILVTLGRHSTREILSMSGRKVDNVGSVRGRVHRVRISDLEVVVLPTYHPAAALYNPRLRRIIEEDFARLGDMIKRGGIMDYL